MTDYVEDDWFNWIVGCERRAGNPDPLLTAAKAEQHIFNITGRWPRLEINSKSGEVRVIGNRRKLK